MDGIIRKIKTFKISNNQYIDLETNKIIDNNDIIFIENNSDNLTEDYK